MKPIPFHIPKTHREVFRVQQDTLPYFYDRLHLHEEVQITFIEAGTGTLIAGDYIGRFYPGDVFLIGKQLPHVFRCDAAFYQTDEGVKGISVFFDESYAGAEFWETDELKATRDWLAASGQGFRGKGVSREVLGDLIRRMVSLDGLNKLIAGFQLVKAVSENTEFEQLSMQEGKDFSKQILGDRMNKIVSFTFREHHRPVPIDEVAAMVSLTPSAFCRFFKSRTRKSYLTFLNEIRIGHACRLLVTTDLPIYEISYRVGFVNLSHFNQNFKKSKGTTPSAFRQSFELK